MLSTADVTFPGVGKMSHFISGSTRFHIPHFLPVDVLLVIFHHVQQYPQTNIAMVKITISIGKST